MAKKSTGGLSETGGNLGLRVIRRGDPLPEGIPRIRNITRTPVTSVPGRELSLSEILKHGTPQKGLAEEVNDFRKRNAQHLWRGLRKILVARTFKIPHHYGQLSLAVIHPNGSVTDLGLASLRVVTNAGVNFVIDAMQGLLEPEIMRYHGIGTGAAAEAAGDTALGTELTTQYTTDNTRATGTQTEGASANIFRTVGTNTVDSSVSITEHGLLSQAAVGGGTLFDRSVFTAVALAPNDSLQSTYDWTLNSGG